MAAIVLIFTASATKEKESNRQELKAAL